ncbi:MAG: roadblock/LC7 domain-containing protein [Promethearchaeota archaeon]
MSNLTPEEAQNLAIYLGKITDNTDLEALALVTREGMRLAFSAIPGYDINPDQLSSMAAVLLQSSEDAVEKMGYDKLSETVVRGKNSFLVIAAAGRFFLIGASREIKDLAKIVSVFRFYAKKIAERYPEV